MISHYPLLSTQRGPYHWASCPHILSVAYRCFCLLPDCPYWEVGCRASKCPHLGHSRLKHLDIDGQSHMARHSRGISSTHPRQLVGAEMWYLTPQGLLQWRLICLQAQFQGPLTLLQKIRADGFPRPNQILKW